MSQTVLNVGSTVYVTEGYWIWKTILLNELQKRDDWDLSIKFMNDYDEFQW